MVQRAKGRLAEDVLTDLRERSARTTVCEGTPSARYTDIVEPFKGPPGTQHW